MPVFDISLQDDRRPRRVVDDAFDLTAVEEAKDVILPVCLLRDGLPPAARSPALAVFAFGDAPCAFAHTRFRLVEIVGAVLLPEVDCACNRLAPSVQDRSCYVYLVPLASESAAVAHALVFCCQYPIAAERAAAWADVILSEVTPARALVLDAQPWRVPRAGTEEPLAPAIRTLETSAHRALRATGALAAPALEPTGMVGGASAAVLVRCEADGVAAVLVLAALTGDDALHEILVGFERCVGCATAPGAPLAALADIRRTATAAEAHQALIEMASLLSADAVPSADMFA
jgi:hypothetical protein